VILGPSSLYKRTKTAIVNYLKRSVALSNPTNELGTEARQTDEIISSKSDLPRFWLRVLTVTVGNFPLPSALKGRSNGPIFILVIGKSIACGLYIPSFVSGSNSLITPASFRMATKITG
jgi:hypothetical protein